MPSFPHLNNFMNSSVLRPFLSHLLYPVSYILFFAVSLHAQDPGSKSRVAYLENPNLLNNYDPDPEGVKNALSSLLTTLTGKSTTTDAWKSLGIGPDDVVAIKINARGDVRTSTRRSLTDAVTASLIATGLKPDQITLWDKVERDMVLSGYPLRKEPGQVQIRAIQAGPRSDIPGLGWDPDAPPYFNATMGQLIYGDLKFQPSLMDGMPMGDNLPKSSDKIPNWSYYTKILTQKTTKLINLGSMTSDPDLGIYGCCASLALGSVDNNRRLIKTSRNDAPTQESYPPTIGEILISDPIKPKTVLHVSDGLIVTFAGSRDFDASYATTPGILLASTDPVALDAMALDRFEKLRANPGTGIPPIPKIGNVSHVAGAVLVGAGNADPTKIEIVNVK